MSERLSADLCHDCRAVFASERVGNRHHENLASFRQAAEAGCPICRRILYETNYFFVLKNLQISCYSTLIIQDINDDSIAVRSKLLRPDGLVAENILFLKPYLETLTVQRPSSEHTGSSESWRLVEEWMNTCIGSHKDCRSFRDPSWYPIRLVDIGHSPDQFRIVDGTDLPPGVGYLTLSHRWGAGDITKLHADKLDEFRAGIDITPANLSATFRDAIAVTRRFGLRYIWIDSLCIIQEGDKNVDWSRQAPMMKNIYSNALCNISADWAAPEEPESGLFFRRDLSWFDAVKIPFRAETWSLDPAADFLREVDSSPLSKRGWVAQERLLSPRCIHFCRRQVVWECRESMLGESSSDWTWTAVGLGSRSAALFRKKTLHGRQESGLAWDGKKALSTWRYLLGHYTKCQFTYIEDKFVAFSGIAQQLKPCIGSQYIAGLWEEYLLIDLAWERCAVDSGSVHGNAGTCYSAPSFSWASCHFPVQFSLETDRLDDIEPLTSASCVHMSSDDPIVQDVYGPLRSPVVRLKLGGKLEKVTLTLLPSQDGSCDEVSVSGGLISMGSIGRLDFDAPPAFLLEGRFFGMPLFKLQPSERGISPLLTVLLLELLDEARFEYRRIGLANFYQPFDGDPDKETWSASHFLGDDAEGMSEDGGPGFPGIYDTESGRYIVYVV